MNKHVIQWFLRITLLALGCAGGAAYGQPVVSSFAPASGAPGTSVIITGANFSGATKVQFKNVDAIFEVLSSMQLAATVPIDALTGQISVTTFPGGTRSSSGTFYVAPRITGFSPAAGLAGTIVIISGANFRVGLTTVQFNGVAANASVTGENQIHATVPAGATNGFITVTTPDGGATGADSFLVSNAPIITEFSPTIAKYGGIVTINGMNFVVNGTTVKFNGTSATSVSYTGQNGTQIQVNVPNGATTGPITVSTANGTNTTSTNFVTGAGPIITGFSPISGAVGAQVTITGINFNNATAVTFSNNIAASFSPTADTQIIAMVPSGAVTGPIRVTAAGITSISPIAFHAGPDPIITDFSPTNGPVGADVVLYGANLTPSTAIRFNGVLVNSVSITGQGGSQAHVHVPAGATSGLITVSDGTTTNSSPTAFVVTGPGPSINSFSPSSGPVGTDVIIEGDNFVGVTGVSFNGVAVLDGYVSSPTQIHATVPAGATTGFITVSTLSGTATTTVKFFVWPRITGFSPATGVAGTSVNITGANFTNATAVQFNGTAASFTVNSGTNLTATVPEEAITGTISVTTPAGIVASPTNFFVSPRISGFTPASGSVNASVLISGSALRGATSVKFNGTAAIFSVISRRQIVAVVPALASSGPITVTTGEGTATSGTDFKILPTITGFAPAHGPAGGLVVVTGNNFAGVIGVYFNGESAAFTLNSPGQLTATVPVLATPGRIAVATADGFSMSATDFQVLPRLYIGALSGPEVLLGWPTWATNFVVEATINLVPVVIWTTVTNTPSVQGGENLLFLEAASGPKFFRMRGP